jgi:drug/metabolite transporter (DMT)-like permease
MVPTDHAQRRRALWMLVLANFFWGLSFPVIKSILLLHGQLVPEAGSWFSAIYTVAPRFLLATALLLAWRPVRCWEIAPGEWKQGVTIGLFASVGMILQNDALQYTAASTSAFLTQFYAILIPVYLAVRQRRNPGARVWVCCALVLGGVAILGGFDWRELHMGRGEWETLLSSLFFMGQILCLERKEFAGNRVEKMTLVMFATQALVFWSLVGVLAPDLSVVLRPWTSAPWLTLTLVLTVFCTIGAFTIMNTWQPKISATEAGLVYCIEPIFGSIMACFLPGLFSVWAAIHYPNETATWTLILGGGLITVANVLLQLRPAGK